MDSAHGGIELGQVLVILAAAVAAVLVFRRLRLGEPPESVERLLDAFRDEAYARLEGSWPGK